MYSIADDYNCRQAHRLHEAATRLQAEIEWQVSSYCFLILISGYKLTAYILQWLRTDYKIIAFRTELHHGRRQTKRKRMP